MGAPLPIVPEHTLLRSIGKGAYGEVWLARSVVGTYRAVKVVSKGDTDDGHNFRLEFEGIQRFEPVSRLHEGLVDILQIGKTADERSFYYVMELGDDVEPRQEFDPDKYKPRTLSAECRRRNRKRIPATEAALIGAQLAEALEYLHKRGLIHRDIKPSNVLFVLGQPRIGDPGLVTSVEASQSMRGTLGYIAPEGPGTAQADVFGLGKLLYVIGTGMEPGLFPVLPPEMTNFPDAADLRRLNQVLLRACSYNPKERYASAADLRRDLLEVHAGGSPGETRRRLRIAKRVGIALFILLILIAAGFYRAQLQAKADSERLAKNHLERAIRSQEGNDALGALPFLGSVLEADSDAAPDLTQRRIGFIWRYSPRLLAQWYSTNAANRIAFSADGSALAIACAGGDVWLWRWRRSAASPEHLFRHRGADGSNAEAEGVAFSPDGRLLASVGLDGLLHLAYLGTNAVSRTISLDRPAHAVAFHPNSSLLTVACGGGGDKPAILLVDADSGNVRTLFPITDTPNCVTFSPDGKRITATDQKGYAYEWALDDPLQKAPAITKPGWIYEIGFNRDGSLQAAAIGLRPQLTSSSGLAPIRLKHNELVRSVAFDPSAPPGSDRLLTSSLDNSVRLWSCADSEEIMPPIHTEREPTGAFFSPDGAVFAVSTVGGLVRIYHRSESIGDRGTNRLSVSLEGDFYALNEQGSNAVIRHAATDRIEQTISTAGDPIDYTELSRNGRELLIRRKLGGDSVHYEIRDVKSRSVLAETNVNGDSWANLSPNGDCLAIRQPGQLSLLGTNGRTRQLQSWAVSDLHGEVELRFNSTGTRLVAGWNNSVAVFAVPAGERVAEWSVEQRAKTVDVSADGRFVVIGESPVGFAASTNFVWDIATRRRASPPLALADGSFVARFSPSGRTVLISDEEGNVLLHEVGTTRIIPVSQRFGLVTDAAFTPDGRFVATVTGDRGGRIPSLQVWDTETGNPVTTVVRAPRSTFGRPRFLANGTQLLWHAYGSRLWQRWHIADLSAPAADLIDLTRLLSCQTIAPNGQSVSVPPVELDRLWSRLFTKHPEWFMAPK